MKKPKCDDAGHKFCKYQAPCEKTGEYVGWDYRCMVNKRTGRMGRMRKVFHRWCGIHWLEHMIGIIALKCPRCWKKQQKATDVHLDPEDKYTYVPMRRFFAMKAGTWGKKDEPPAFDVSCWFCGFVFQKGGKK